MAFPRFQYHNGIAAFEARLRELEGKVGLDPLDPVQPLASVRIVGFESSQGAASQAQVRFTYADGSNRTYPTWLGQSLGTSGGWRPYSGLDRAFAPHLELPGLSMAGLDAPIRIGTPVPLAINSSAPLLLSPNYNREPLFSSPGSLWSPNGDAVLLPITEPGSRQSALWLVRLNGTPPLRLASDVSEATWSPDGRIVFYRTGDSISSPIQTVSARDGSRVWTAGPSSQARGPFTVTADTFLFARDGILWRKPFDETRGTIPVRVRDLPGHELAPRPGPQSLIAIDVSGQRIAYACGPDLCLTDVDGGTPTHIEVGVPPSAVVQPSYPVAQPQYPVGSRQPPAIVKPGANDGPVDPRWNILRMSWSPDGQRLAVTSDTQGYWPIRPPELSILDRSGKLLARFNVGPNGPLDAPHWTADGRFILLRAYPENGRRIVAVEVATSRVFDLSQPGWDALFSPSPDGSRLLLTNGRGGFWIAPIERR